MKNKYYVPTLEEFHVGFRFELYSLQWGEEEEELFYWEEVYLDGNLEGTAIDLADGLIRVKYLDQADLEELGWKRVYKDIYEKVVEGRDKDDCWQITLNSPEVYIRNYLLDKGTKWSYTSNILFGLTADVKNYNEMKKVMEILRIN